MIDALEETPIEKFSQEEKEFAISMQEEGFTQNGSPIIREDIVKGKPTQDYGSSDVGDVQHINPGVFFTTNCRGINCSNHTWQSTVYYGMSIGLKGMIYASKVMTQFGIKVLVDPTIVEKAKQEFNKKMDGTQYICPMNDN